MVKVNESSRVFGPSRHNIDRAVITSPFAMHRMHWKKEGRETTLLFSTETLHVLISGTAIRSGRTASIIDDIKPLRTLAEMTGKINCIAVADGSTPLFAILHIKELQLLAHILGCEIADIVEHGLKKDGNNLKLRAPATGRIRETIRNYLEGSEKEIPPTLYADIPTDKKILFYRNGTNDPVYLDLSSKSCRQPIFAQLRLLSKTEVSVVIFAVNEVGSKYHLESFTMQLMPIKQEPTTPKLSAKAVSQAIQDWLFKNKEIPALTIQRNIYRRGGTSFTLHLTSNQGLPYRLPVTQIGKTGAKSVNIVLSDGRYYGMNVKTARLFPIDVDPKTNPGNPLAVFLLPNDRDSDAGIRIEDEDLV